MSCPALPGMTRVPLMRGRFTRMMPCELVRLYPAHRDLGKQRNEAPAYNVAPTVRSRSSPARDQSGFGCPEKQDCSRRAKSATLALDPWDGHERASGDAPLSPNHIGDFEPHSLGLSEALCLLGEIEPVHANDAAGGDAANKQSAANALDLNRGWNMRH